MIRVTVTEEDKRVISEMRFTCGDPILSRRLHILFFLSLNLSYGDICQYVEIGRSTLTRTLKKYAKGGLDAVMKVNFVPRCSPLEAYRDQIKKHFTAHPPSSVKKACAEIEALTGVKRQPSRIRKFLHQLGMKPRKVGGVPAKADAEKQENFKKKASSQSSKRQKMEKPPSILWMPPTLS